jgi:hypothetical protein
LGNGGRESCWQFWAADNDFVSGWTAIVFVNCFGEGKADKMWKVCIEESKREICGIGAYFGPNPTIHNSQAANAVPEETIPGECGLLEDSPLWTNTQKSGGLWMECRPAACAQSITFGPVGLTDWR